MTNKSENEKLERGNKNDLLNINNFFENDPGLNDKLQNFKEHEEDEHKMQTNRNKAFLKKNRWVEIVLMIEKTFGSKITFLLFYLIFVLIILYSIVTNQNVVDKSKMHMAIKNQFLYPEFIAYMKVLNYVERKKEYSDYKVKLNFNEINDVRLFPLWMDQVFLENLGFYTKEFMFLEKHQLIGKMRFLQIREEPKPECDEIPKFYNDTSKDLTWCFKEAFEPSSDPLMKFDCAVLKDYYQAESDLLIANMTKKTPGVVYVRNAEYCNDTQNYDAAVFKNPCKYLNESNEINESNPFVCELQRFGFKNRDLSRNISDNFTPNSTSQTFVKQKFIYNGLINKHNTDRAYYFDLDFNGISSMYDFNLDYNDSNFNATDSVKILYKKKLQEFSEHLFLSWLDYNSRLFVISFNIYKTTSTDDEEVISVSFYLEFSKTQFIQKNFEILFYKKINISFNDYLYFFILFIYSITYLYFNIIEIIKERMNIIYKQFIMFLINFSLNCLILVVMILKIIIVLQSRYLIKPYVLNKFQEYFPINYYKQIENYIFLLEILMIAIIIVNTLNSFYFEFFARIFLTFKYMWRHLVAYITIYLIIIIAFSTSCFMLYGNNIMGKNYLLFFILFFFEVKNFIFLCLI